MPAISSTEDQNQQTLSAALLSAGMIHDLNNLLTIVNGYQEILYVSPEVPEKLRAHVASARVAGMRAAALARALMTVGRTVPLEPRRIQVNDCVQELVALTSQWLPPNIAVAAHPASGIRPVMADAAGILQALLNLVLNSRDAMPGGGKLDIATANVTVDEAPAASDPALPAGDYVLLTVTDNGAGMSESARRRIFEPFYTTKPPAAGAGLGLPMVRHIVARSGGYLSVESAEGKGTIVRIYLPAVEAEAAARETAPAPATPVTRQEILVVEGDGDLRVLMHELLAHFGYRVQSAASAAEAAALAGSPDLLITDTVLPDSSGTALAAALRGAHAGLQVLYVSEYGREAGGQEGPAPDADMLLKPFTPGELGDRVRAILDRPRRVLFVDDDEQMVAFASDVLRHAGYDVLTGSDGEVALLLARRERLDLVITDLVMREREGLDTIMRLRESNPELPVIAISGAFGGHFLRSAAILGARATLAKPFSGEDLVSAVRAILGG